MRDPTLGVPKFPLRDLLERYRQEGKLVVDAAYRGPDETDEDGDERFDRLVELELEQICKFVSKARPDESLSWNRFTQVLLELMVERIRRILQAQILYLRGRRDAVSRTASLSRRAV